MSERKRDNRAVQGENVPPSELLFNEIGNRSTKEFFDRELRGERNLAVPNVRYSRDMFQHMQSNPEEIAKRVYGNDVEEMFKYQEMFKETMNILRKGLNAMAERKIYVGKVVVLKDGEQVVKYDGREVLLSEARKMAGSWATTKRACHVDVDKGIEVLYCYPKVQVPCYQTSTAVAFDIRAAERTVIPSVLSCQKPILVHTGLNVDFGKDESFVLVNRSGTPKHGLIMANGIGIFENDYYQNDINDGEILVSYINFTSQDVIIEEGDRIAQGTFIDIKRASNLEVLDNERRGGFGSTGKS